LIALAPALCVSIHDVAPATWERCRRLLAAVAEVAPVPLTLLVVPDYHRRGDGLPPWYRNALADRLAAGDELALHGLVHLDEAPPPRSPTAWFARRVLTAAEGEFAALPADAAAARLQTGLACFRAAGWPLRGFVAPAWLLGDGGWRALEASPFAYTTTAAQFHLLHPRRAVAAPVIAYSTRSRARRLLSLAWHRLHRPADDAPLVRLALHPDDALYPAVLRQAQRQLEGLLATRLPMTKGAFADALGATTPA